MDEDNLKFSSMFGYLGVIFGVIFYIILGIFTILGIINRTHFMFILIFLGLNLILLAIYSILSLILALIFKLIEVILTLSSRL